MRNFWYILSLVLLILVFFGLTIKIPVGDTTSVTEQFKFFESSQERARFFLTRNLIEGNGLVLDNYAKESLPDVSYFGKHYVSIFMPGASLLGVPGYLAGLKIDNPLLGVVITSVLFSILSSILLFYIGRNLGQSKFVSFLSAVVFSLGSIFWSYSESFYAYPFTIFFLLAGLYFALRVRDEKDLRPSHLLVILSAGIGFFLDFTNIPFYLPIIAYTLINLIKNNIRQQSGTLISAIGVFSLLLMLATFVYLLLLYNFSFFGGWLNLPHSYRVTTLVASSPEYHFGLAKAFSLDYLENGLYTLLLSLNRGLLFYCPIFIFSIAGHVALSKRLNGVSGLFLTMIFVNLLVYSLFYDPWGGWAFGPRYLIISMPLLAILVGESYQVIKERILYLLAFVGLFFASFAIAAAGALTTNMIPPFAEVGKQLTFTHAFTLLLQQESRSTIFDLINGHYFISGLEYFILVCGVFVVIFMPTYISQLLLNLINYFNSLKEAIIIKRSQSVPVEKRVY